MAPVAALPAGARLLSITTGQKNEGQPGLPLESAIPGSEETIVVIQAGGRGAASSRVCRVAGIAIAVPGTGRRMRWTRIVCAAVFAAMAGGLELLDSASNAQALQLQ